MRKIFSLLMLSAIGLNAASAQDTLVTTKSATKTYSDKKPSRDFVMLQLSSDHWANTPDSIRLRNSGRGIGFYICYDFPIKNSNFSFAAGLGISANNVYFKNQRMFMNENGQRVRFADLDSAGSARFKGQKLTTAYLEMPLELRYFSNKENRNKGFKVAIGAKIGFNGIGGAHYKERESIDGKYVTEKVVTRRFIESWRLAPTFRIGYGNFSVFGQYSVTSLFTAGMGPEVHPFSIGICISGL